MSQPNTSSAASSPLAASPPFTASRTGGRIVVALFIVAWAMWAGMIGWVRVSNPGIDHGDLTMDANILNAGENFDREGLWAHWGVPAVDTYRGEGKTPDFYVTYPPGCYWLHQILKSIGIRELPAQRLEAVGASSLAVLLFFVLCLRISGSAVAAAVAGAAYMLTRPYAEYADHLHYVSHSQLTLMATLLGWLLIEDAKTPRARLGWTAATAAMFGVDSIVTLEHALFVPAFACVRIALSRRWGLIVPVLVLCSMPLLVLALRFGISAAAVGGFEPVWNQLRGKLRQRTGTLGAGVGFGDVGRELLARLGWPTMRGSAGGPDAEFRIGMLAPAVLVPMSVLFVMAMSTWHLEAMKPVRRMAAGALALAVGGATWFIVMREHAAVHRFTIVLMLPAIGAAIGALVAAGWTQWRCQPRGAPVRLAGLVAGCVLLVAHVSQLRHSHLLNIPWRLDKAVYARNQARAEFESRFAAAKPEFACVKRLYMVSHDPQAPRKLGVPFDTTNRVLHLALAEGEAQAVGGASEFARSRAAEAHAALGPARRLAPPADYFAVFFPGRSGLGAAKVAGSQGLSLRRVWAEPTLDGAALIVGAEIVSDLATGGSPAKDYALHVRAVGAGESQLARLSIGLDACAAADGAGHAWVYLDAAAIADAESIELWLVNRKAKRRVVFSDEAAELPEGARLGTGGRSVLLTPP